MGGVPSGSGAIGNDSGGGGGEDLGGGRCVRGEGIRDGEEHRTAVRARWIAAMSTRVERERRCSLRMRIAKVKAEENVRLFSVRVSFVFR
jgi:hypothetical protein